MSQPETLGARLRRLRLTAGLTQGQLGGEALDPSYVSLLERDRRRPTERTIRVLASRLGCDTRLLADGVPSPDENILLAKAELGLGNPQEAVRLVEDIVERVGSDRIADASDFEAIETYATALERMGEGDAASRWLEHLFQAAEQNPLKFPMIRVSAALVRCHSDSANYFRAIQVGEQAVRLRRDLELTWTAECGALVSTLALAYARAGDSYYASVLLDELADEAERNKDAQSAAYALWNSAIVAVNRGHAADGRVLIERARTLLDETDDLRNRSRVRSAQASVLLLQSPPDAVGARRILRAELATLRQHNGALSVARAEVELARCELLLGRPQVARRLAASAIKRMPESHQVERAEADIVHAMSLAASGEPSLAVSALEDSINLLTDLGAARQAANAASELANVYASTGETQNALTAARNALALLGVTATAKHLHQRQKGKPNHGRARQRQLEAARPGTE